MIDITEEDFETEVLKSEKPVVLEFSARWCGFCTAISDDIDELEKRFGEKIKFVSFDVDKGEDFALDYGVNFVPSFIFFEKGEVVKKMIGETNPSNVEAQIKSML